MNNRAALFLLLPALVAAAPRHHRASGVVSTAKDAKSIAEQETGGVAVSARKIPLNGASCGWEVEVHMPKEAQGWRCVIDADTRSVHTKSHIPNPQAGRHR